MWFYNEQFVKIDVILIESTDKRSSNNVLNILMKAEFAVQSN